LEDIRVSKDGGQTWESLENPGTGNCMISFADAEKGWVYASPQILATVDGGKTWSEVAPPEGVADVEAISLRTSSDGYIMTPEGDLYTTQDGGKSWTSSPLNLTGYEEMVIVPGDLPSAAIRFFDADNGLIVLSLVGGGKSAVVALHTTDGGATWIDEVALSGDVGVTYLTHDGKYLTLNSFLKTGQVTVLEYKGD
jgi:photosystem II stability/assembly factor-like uncharacterized protein